MKDANPESGRTIIHHTFYSIIILLSLLTFSACKNDNDNHSLFSKLEYHLPEEFSDSILVGSYSVYEDRENQEGRKIDLSIMVTPALLRDSLKEPIFIIDGGPGVGVSHQAFFYTLLDDRYRKYHDIVFVDVRGTGKSSPLHCIEIQTKRSPAEHFEHPYPEQELADCIASLSDTVNFNYYKTRHIVEDFEEIRQWLGFEKINLLGISFGGKVALKYMDMYPEAINRSVLHASDAPNVDHLSRRGRSSQKAMDLLFQYCKEDSLCNTNFPNFKREFQVVMDRTKTQNINYEFQFGDSIETIQLKWPPIARKLAGMLYEDIQYARIPYMIHEAYNQNYSPLLWPFNMENTETSYFFADGMFLSNICSEDIPKAIENYSEAEKNTFLGDYILQTRRDACDHWPVKPLDDSEYDPVISEIPTLIISGGMDPTLPPWTGREIAKHLSNSEHIVIPYMGHMLGDLSNMDCYDNYVIAFLENRQKSTDQRCFESMKHSPFYTGVEN